MCLKRTIVRLVLGVPVWVLANVASGQTIADTLTDEERTVGNVVYTTDQVASLKGTMPSVYEALLADQWRSRNGFEQYRLVVSQLHAHWGSKETVSSHAALNRVDGVATDEQVDILEPVFERASTTLLQTHLASEQVRNASDTSFDELLRILATTSESEVQSFKLCIHSIKTAESDCFRENQHAFDMGIDECMTKSSTSESANRMLGACTLFKHQAMTDDLTSCLVNFSNDSRRCLSEIDWPATQ